jgi:hypothetical protein
MNRFVFSRAAFRRDALRPGKGYGRCQASCPSGANQKGGSICGTVRDPEGLFELPTHYFREGELTHVHDGVDEETILSPVKERLGARK